MKMVKELIYICKIFIEKYNNKYFRNIRIFNIFIY